MENFLIGVQIKEILFCILGILGSWIITRAYYLKSLAIQRKEILDMQKEYREIIGKFAEKLSSDGEIDKQLLRETRLQQCVEKYTRTGGGEYLINLINTYTDLSDDEKADMLDAALLRARGRKAKENPYRKLQMLKK